MLRDNLAGLIEPMLSSARAYPLALCTDRNESSDDRPQDALKIPARQGGIYTLAENVASPFHAEPPHNHLEPILNTSQSERYLLSDLLTCARHGLVLGGWTLTTAKVHRLDCWRNG